MGLDINFFRLKKANYDQYQKDNEFWEMNICPEPLSDSEFRALSEEEQQAYVTAKYDKKPQPDNYGDEIGYFRKVNFLVSYFNYEENCSFQEINVKDIERLQTRCEKILEAYEQDKEGEEWPKTAEDFLPTESGFFFGSTDYDDWYIQDVREVKEWCEEILPNTDADDVVLMYCWW